MTKLYEKKVTPNSLENGLNIEESYATIDTGVKIDFTEFNDFFDTVKDDESIQKHDYDFSKLIFKAISKSGIENKYLYDLRFWQWITLNEIKEYCLWRWKINEEAPTKLNRFLGAGGVTGFSINSASRLYFPAVAIMQDSKGDELLKDFWTLTQKELSISQSALSIDPKIYIALVKATKGMKGEAISKTISKLNLLGTSYFLDLMDIEEIITLITLEN